MKAVLIIPFLTLCAGVEATCETCKNNDYNKKMLCDNDENEPNPPVWPTDGSVLLIHPTDDMNNNHDETSLHAKLQQVQDPWNEAYQTHTSDLHFSSRRQVVLFAPGEYNKDNSLSAFQVGYYTQVLGLGKTPLDVLFQGGNSSSSSNNNNMAGPYVAALNKHLHHHRHGTCLDTFWRSAENFATTGDLQWAVSQAAPLRRVHVGGNLLLHDAAAYASGGFVANTHVQGQVQAGGQQQYLLRNVHLGQGAKGGAWSMVYVGCTSSNSDNHTAPVTAHPGNASHPAVTVLEQPWLRLEKPYLIQKETAPPPPLQTGEIVSRVQRKTSYALVVPQIRQAHHPTQLTGVQWEHDATSEERDLTRVRVVHANQDDAPDRIQQALDQGKDVVLTPGIIRLSKSIVMRHANQVLLGLGLVTLVNPLDGSPCIQVEANVPGIRIAGVMLQASETKSTTSLLQWGRENTPNDEGDASNPGGLFDVFVRVGGPPSRDRKATRVDTMMRLYSGNIVADNLWLWRADHSELHPEEEANYQHISPLYWQSEDDEFIVDTGLHVAGNNITMYGLAVEHANGHQTKWTGEYGRVAFYQCELPYGVSQKSFGDSGFTGYLVEEQVTHHEVLAPGIYSNFRNGPVNVPSAIRHPPSPTINVVNPFTVWLDNHFGIQSIVNGQGKPTEVKGVPTRMSMTLRKTVEAKLDQ